MKAALGIGAATILSLAAFTPTSAHAAPVPDRNAAAIAVMGWMACDVADCPPARRRAVIRSLRCRAMTEEEGPPRVLCRFSGHYELIDGSRARFPTDCAYFWRPDGVWTVQAMPDHDLCDV